MRFSLLILSLCSALLWPLSGRAQSDQIVYDDALENGWQNFGWATLNYANTSPVHSGSHSISVVDPTTTFEALYLGHAAQSTAPYVSLRFYLYVTTSNAHPVFVQATRSGTSQTGVALSGLTPNAWNLVTLSLASLSVGNVSDFDGFWLQNNTGGAQTFYVDDISLVAVAAPNPVQVNVDAGSVIRTIDGRLYGINISMWDSHLGDAASGTLLSTIGTQMIRFPGGSAADDYDWHTNQSASNGGYQSSHAGTFAKVVSARGAQGVVTVNYGAGTPEEAAAWVAYYNAATTNTTSIGVDAMGKDFKTAGFWAGLRAATPLGTDDGYNFLRINHPTPFAFTYWEIGNECYGTWENDLHGVNGSGLTGAKWDPYTYAQYFVNFRTKMFAVDPTIHLGAVAVTGEDTDGLGTHPVANPNEGNSTHTGWVPVMLNSMKSLGVAPHFLIYHDYPQDDGSESDSFLLQTGSGVASDAANLRKMITDYYPSASPGIELLMTELNSAAALPGKQTVSLVNGLFMADMMGMIARTEFNSVLWWDFHNGAYTNQNNSSSLYGWRIYGDYGIIAAGDRGDTPLNTPYPSFYAAKLLTHWGRGGDKVVTASTNYALLSTHAALLANGNLALLIVNKSPTTDFNTQINLSNFLPGALTASTWAYGKTNDSSNADLSTSTINNTGSTITGTFPAYSMTVIVLQKPQSFAGWQAQYFNSAQLADPSVSGPNADPQHIGIPNLMEYALGLVPATATTKSGPVLGQMVNGGKNYLTITFNKPRVIGDVQYNVQVSSDLVHWNSGSTYAVRVDDGSTDTAVYRDVMAIEDAARHFMRLQVGE